MNSSVGYQVVELFDVPSRVTFPMAIMFPTCGPAKTEKIGPYSLELAIDAAPSNGTFPLAIISHGSGGSHLVYRTLAHHLASNGFVVGMPEHPFNNRNNNSLEGTVENLSNRPRHIRTAVDWFFDSVKFGSLLKPDAVSLIGHSMGGYTALALAGGVPTSLAQESPDRQSQQIRVTPDHRIKALVLLAPAAVWFVAVDALLGVKVPILMLVGEKDEYVPYEYHAQLILDGLPDVGMIQYRIVENAGHFSFLSPFPAAMTNPAFPPSQDPLGFNREHFLNEMNAEVLDFLRRTT